MLHSITWKAGWFEKPQMCNYKWLINVIMILIIGNYRITTSLINKIQRDIMYFFRFSKVAEQVFIMLTFFIAILVIKTLGRIIIFHMCEVHVFLYVCFRVPHWILSQKLFQRMQSSKLWRKLSIYMCMSRWRLPFCYWMLTAHGHCSRLSIIKYFSLINFFFAVSTVNFCYININ